MRKLVSLNLLNHFGSDFKNKMIYVYIVYYYSLKKNNYNDSIHFKNLVNININ